MFSSEEALIECPISTVSDGNQSLDKLHQSEIASTSK